MTSLDDAFANYDSSYGGGEMLGNPQIDNGPISTLNDERMDIGKF